MTVARSPDELQAGHWEVIHFLGVTNLIDVFMETFSPIDLLFYGLALWEGYTLVIMPLADAVARAPQVDDR